MSLVTKIGLYFWILSCIFFSFNVVFCTDHLKYEIKEEEQPGTYIGNILTDSSLTDNYTSEITRILEFEFLTSGHITSYFELKRNSGILKTATDIDREIICRMQKDCVVNLDIAVQPSTYFQVIKVRITILDKNDFIPEFDLDDIEQTLAESVAPGVILPILPARDFDSPEFGVKSYELRGGDDKFSIDVTELGEAGVDIRLVLNSPLDRETQDEYVLELFAYDGGEPPLVGTQIIRLKITDTNDNIPMFFQQTYETQVEENYPVSLPMTSVTARDIDIGKNGKLTYSLEAKSDRLYGDTFEVDKDNGTLLLIKELDYERQTLYSLKILASDNGEVPLTSTAIIIIHVVDVNDNPPVIKVNDDTLRTSITVLLEENQPEDTFVAIISVSDVDQGENGLVDCSLRQLENGPFRMFEMMANEYKIVTTRPLDREEQADHSIRVSCTDRGKSPLSSYVNINIDVRDTNDNTPIFTNAPYNFIIEENNREHAFVGQVKARDNDVGGNGKISYQFCNSIDSPRDLVLDERNGVITAKTHFDHEIFDVINVCIEARDHGTRPNFATTYVTITISDVNDNEPKFNQSAYDFVVPEDAQEGTIVGTIAAYDLDSPPFDMFLFVLDLNPYFVVHNKHGTISTTKRLDREETEQHHLTAYVKSQMHPQMSDFTDITINVLDKNDNKPTILSPTPNAVLPPISSQVPIGYNITKVIAADKDIGKNGLLNYSLTEFETGLFNINSATGWIMTARDLSFVKTVREFMLRVTVRDNGIIPRETTTIFTVVVNASIPYHTPVTGAHATLFRPEVQLMLVAAAVALVLVIIIISTVCVLFVRSRKSSHSKSGYWVAASEEQYGRDTKTNGNAYTLENCDGSLEEKMALSEDKEEEPPAPPSVYHGSCHQCRTIPEDVEMSISGGSDESPASENSHSHNGSHYETSSLGIRSNQCLLDNNTAPKPYGFYNKSGTAPRHVRFCESNKSHETNSLDRGGILIRNPEVLLDGTDGTFV